MEASDLGDPRPSSRAEVRVRVTGEEEAGTVTLSPTRPQVGTALTATLSTPSNQFG